MFTQQSNGLLLAIVQSQNAPKIHQTPQTIKALVAPLSKVPANKFPKGIVPAIASKNSLPVRAYPR
ncbi:hypothetical protein [Nostoc sp.]